MENYTKHTCENIKQLNTIRTITTNNKQIKSILTIYTNKSIRKINKLKTIRTINTKHQACKSILTINTTNKQIKHNTKNQYYIIQKMKNTSNQCEQKHEHHY